MNLFDKLFKNDFISDLKDTDIVSPVTGKMISPKEIKDNVFSEEIIGKTIGFIPSEGVVVSPVSGKIVSLFPTYHAIGIEGNDGNSYLVHIGIDTVSMNGNGFKAFVEKDQHVHAGQKIVSVDLQKIVKSGLDPTVMLIVASLGSGDSKVNYIDYQDVVRGDRINF